MIGRTISHYRIIGKLGEGGMGVVYRAVDTRLDREVALKFLPPESTRDPEAKSRFVIEAKAASALDHPNICNIHDIDETPDGRMFLAMTCYEGETLKQRLQGGPLAVDEAVEVAVQISRGLIKAHSHDIIHRDIKPANIFLSADGLVKIVDFGLAKLSGGSGMTRAGATLGTVSFLAPEQIRSEEVDNRTDIFALGVTMYQMVTGRLPFRGDNDQAVLYAILHLDPLPISQVRPDLPPAFARIVDRCLLKNAGSRFGSVSELLHELEALQSAPDQDRRSIETMETVSMALPPRRSRLKRVLGLSSLALSAAVVLVLAFGSGWVHTLGARLGLGSDPASPAVSVLPITLYGGDRDDQAFCDGLATMLTVKLARLERFQPSLWVAPIDLVRRRGVDGIGDARIKLGVDRVITGTMHRYGDVISIDLLCDSVGSDPLPLLFKSQSTLKLADPISNLFTWQDQLAIGVAGLLDIELTPEMRNVLSRGGTTRPEAFVECMRGYGYLNTSVGESAPEPAAASFLSAVAADSSYAMAFLGLAECRLRALDPQDEKERAALAELAEKALQLDGQSLEPRLFLGGLAAIGGNHERAAEYYRTVLAVDPANGEACHGLASSYLAMGDPESAEAVYLELLELRPGVIYCRSRFASFLYGQARYEAAAAEFRAVMDLAPDYLPACTNLGAIYFYQDRREDAEQMFRRSMAVSPNYLAYLNLGTLYFYSQRYLDSALMYEKALELKSDDYMAWGQAAEAHYWAGDGNGKARGQYLKAVELGEAKLAEFPRDAGHLAAMAGYLMKLGEKSRALKCLERFLSLDSHPPQAMFAIADVYEQMGQRELALQWIESAVAGGFATTEIIRYPGMGDLRADQRYRALMARYEGEHR